MKRLLVAAPVALLFACSGSQTEIQPGQWEFTIRMTDVELPGVPEQMAVQMRQAMARQTQTLQRCITPQEAANPTGGIMNPGGNDQGCTYTEQTFSGGRIQAAGSCPAPTGGNVQVSMTGSYTDTTIETQVRTETATPQGGPPGMPATLRMSGTMTGRHTGECATSAS